jgi:hypothetical protein
MATTVNILVTAQGVAARENFKDVNRLDGVTWVLAPSSESFQVVFTEFQPLDGPRQTNIPVQGPFSQPLLTNGNLNGGEVTGSVRADAEDGIYFYEIHNNTGKLPWLNPVSEDEEFGGVEVHGPPPRTTG